MLMCFLSWLVTPEETNRVSILKRLTSKQKRRAKRKDRYTGQYRS